MIRVFIVDDRLTYITTIGSLLDSEPDIEVVGVAADGYQAIDKIKHLQPDIVLVYLEVPKIGGLETTRLICQQNRDLKVLVLSDRDEEDLVNKVINAGAKGYLLKDVSSPEIVKAIRFAYKEDPQNISTVSNNSFPSFTNTMSNSHLARKIEYPIIETVVNDRGINDFKSSKEFDLSLLLTVLKRRYPPALMGFMAVLLGAVIYLVFAERNYQATALISLEDRRESVSELGKDLSSINGSSEYSPLANQARLIKSMPVINSAIKNLTWENNNLFKQISPDEVSSNLNISVIPNTNILEVSYVNSNPERATLILNKVIDTVIEKNTDTIRSQASTVRKFLEQKVSEQGEELKQLETSENLYRSQNGIVNLDNQTANLVNSLNSLETQEQNLLTQIKEQSAKAENFKQLAKVENSEAAYNIATVSQDRQLENLRTQLTEIEAEIAAARSNFTNNHPVVIELESRKAEILNLYQRQVTQTLGEEATVPPSTFTENRSSQQEDGISQEVFSQLIAVENQLEADRNKLQAIQLEKAKLSDRINSLPAKVQSLTELVRQRQQADENLQFLQRKLEEARITEAQLLSNIQIVEPAEMPSSPSSPKIPLVLAVASLTGLILATGIILLLEKIDRTLYDGMETERQLDIPFLAALPNLADNNSMMSLDPDYPIDEGYRLYSRGEIKLFLQDKKLYEPYRTLLKRLESTTRQRLKTVVITSANAREGKSVVAAHLGAVAAMLNRKTLIIDAHLNQPSQHNLFGVKHQPGLAEVVTDRLSLEKVVQSTDITNLSVLFAGGLTCNSCAVVESPALAILLQEATMQYDLVIIDAPSISSNYDAQTLANYSDGLVIVTRPLHTKTDVLERNVVELKKNQVPIIGYVINNAEKQTQSLSDFEDLNYRQSLLPHQLDEDDSLQNSKEISQS